MTAKRKLLTGLLWDVGLPAAVYYGGRALGYDVLPALAAATVAALLRVAFVGVVQRRIGWISAVVGATFALLLGLSLVTGDPRILLARESVLSGAAGLLLVGSCLVGRPLVYTLARKLNAAKPEVVEAWETRWRDQPSFRTHFTTLTAGFGAILLIDAVLRVVLIYSLPLNVMANLSPVLHVAAIALLAAVALWHRNRATKHAEAH